MKTTHSKPCYIYAHRGARKEAADNTRSAFDKALTYAIDGMETDVQLTKDEVSVLYHDRFMDKLGFPDKHIDDFTYQELEQFNFGDGNEQESVFSLKEFLEQYRSCCRLQIEIKNREWEDSERHRIKMRQCLDMLGGVNGWDVFISSFNLECLQYAHKLGSHIPLVYASREIHSIADVRNIFSKNEFLAGLCNPISTLNEVLVGFLQQHNKIIVTYTCNTTEEIQKALDLQVDVLITDDPTKALQMRGLCNDQLRL